MQPELPTQYTEPKVEIDLLFGKDDLLEAISDCENTVRDIKLETIEVKEMITDLGKRKGHYQKLIDAGKYKKEAMEKSLLGMDVEIRKYNDSIDKLKERRKHYYNIIGTLNVKLKEAEKWESSSTILQPLSP